jgi:hypothetical protein
MLSSVLAVPGIPSSAKPSVSGARKVCDGLEVYYWRGVPHVLTSLTHALPCSLDNRWRGVEWEELTLQKPCKVRKASSPNVRLPQGPFSG